MRITAVHFAMWRHCRFVEPVRRLHGAAVTLWCRQCRELPENESVKRLSSILIPEETFIFVKRLIFLPTPPNLPIAWMILSD